MKIKQAIHIEGKCIEDVFNLPCIDAIHKVDNTIFYDLWNGESATIGDWLCEDTGGNWFVLTDEEYKSLKS